MSKKRTPFSPAVRLALFAAGLFFAAIACNLPSDATATSSQETAPPQQEASPPAAEITPTEPVETITVLRADGTEEEIPLTITSYMALLRRHMDSGLWTEGEGLVQLMRLVTGEVRMADIPDANLVVGSEITGIIRWASEYAADPASDPNAAAELTDLLGRLAPSQEVLDAISSPAETGSQPNNGLYYASLRYDDTISSDCQNLVLSGFDRTYIPADNCYVYQERMHNGHSYRLYYPRAWVGDASHTAYIENTLEALVASATVYGVLGTFEDINAMVSLIPYVDDTEDEVTNAFQLSFRSGEACPITLMPVMNEEEDAGFKQIVAHEAFHCFQEWNMNMLPYEAHAWWIEGSAEYFSNYVYPSANHEQDYLLEFDVDSATTPLMDMDYQNYIFFQYLANELGVNSVLDILERVSTAPSASGLAGYAEMEDLFQDFVVVYLSKGVADEDGSTYRVRVPAVSGTKQIEAGTISLDTKAFTATRYLMVYGEGDEYHQTVPESPLHDAVLTPEQRDYNAWRELPEEISGTCEDPVSYTLAFTTTESTAALSIDVESDGLAACDACVVGTWRLENDSMEAFLDQLVASTPAAIPGGFSLEISGNEYYQFLEDGTVFTRRDGFTFSVNVSAYGITATEVIDSQGVGVYGADGENMVLGPIATTVNSVTTDASGLGHEFMQFLSPSAITVYLDGQSGSTDGVDMGSASQPLETTYSCEETQMVIDHEVYGPTLLYRVEDGASPTPLPTAEP